MDEEFPALYAPNLYKKFADIATVEEYWLYVQVLTCL